jgi:hypothetical protein
VAIHVLLFFFFLAFPVLPRKAKLISDIPMDRQNAEKYSLHLPFLNNSFAAIYMEGDKDGEEDGNGEGDGV